MSYNVFANENVTSNFVKQYKYVYFVYFVFSN